MSTLKTLTVNGKTYSVVPVVPTASVNLLASGWVGSEGAYSQVVALAGVTSHTKVDLQPTPEQDEIFLAKTLAFVAENDNGVVTVYSIGDKPKHDYTIQVTMTEVEGNAPIRGNTVGLPNPKPDWNQNDPAKADYIKNKPSSFDGVHIGTDTPPDTANVWVNPNGDPTSTEDWEFDLEDGSTDTKTVVVLNSDEATASGRIGILRVKNANGEWEEIPALIGRPGADGYTPVKGVDYHDGKDGQDGYTPQKNVDYFDGKDGKDGYTPQKNVDYFDGAKGDTGESGVVTPVDGFYTLSVDADGNLWVTSKDGNTPNFEYDSATGNLYVVADGTNVLIGNIKGDKGDKGDPGSAGAAGSNGVSATHSWNGTTLTVTSASGTSSADLKGSKGDKGDKGDTGAAGSDASVTSANIASALGYTPANPSSIPSKTENWTFTLEDGSTVTKSIYVK